MSGFNGVDLDALPRFTCARCGRTFRIPASSSSFTKNASNIVRLGGKTFCEDCAARRFPRRHQPWAELGNQP